MIKKIFILILTLILSLSFSACKKDNNATNKEIISSNISEVSDIDTQIKDTFENNAFEEHNGKKVENFKKEEKPNIVDAMTTETHTFYNKDSSLNGISGKQYFAVSKETNEIEGSWFETNIIYIEIEKPEDVYTLDFKEKLSKQKEDAVKKIQKVIDENGFSIIDIAETMSSFEIHSSSTKDFSQIIDNCITNSDIYQYDIFCSKNGITYCIQVGRYEPNSITMKVN